jgi:hypothetical protein
MKWSIFVLLMVLTPLLASCSDITLDETIELDGNGRPSIGIGKYIPFIKESKSIYFIDGTAKAKIKVFTEDYPILTMDYLKENSKIVYTYGYGEISVPAVFDVVEKEKYRLEELSNSDKGKPFYYTAFRSVYWLDRESILYSVIDPATSEVEIRVYNLKTKEKKLLARKPNIDIEHFNRQEMLLAYSWTQGGRNRTFVILDLNKESEKSLGPLPYYSMIVISKHCYLGFTKEQESQYESNYLVDVIEDDEVVYSDSTYNITSPIAYLPNDKLMIAYMYTDRLLAEEAVGVFRVQLKQKCFQ